MASIIERIDLGCASNVLHALIGLAAALEIRKGFLETAQKWREGQRGFIIRYVPKFDLHALYASHSSSLDQRRRPDTFFTAMATALRWPMITTRRLPRVIPV